MASDTPGKSAKQVAANREDRLKAALKANMAKRKAQARARQFQDNDARVSGDAKNENNNNDEE